MCGICGIYGLNNKELLLSMLNTLRHRGPDSSGVFAETDIGLGISRLKIIDLKTGDQPIYNENGKIVIVYNGEIYNYKQLRQEMVSKGHKFNTVTDTEVIVHLYEEYGLDCVNYLRGMFAFSIWDKEKKRLFLARDRLGKKPLYYFYNGKEFLFASELKALLKHKNISKEINIDALNYYLTFLYIPCPLSIFKDIHKLPAAHILTLENGILQIKRYWKLNFSSQESSGEFNSPEAVIERVKDLLEEAVKLRLASDVPLGVFLSGGIDSSALVAMMRRVTKSEIRTFSVGFDAKYAFYNELKFAGIVAEHFGTKHEEFIVKPDIIKLLPKVAWHLDEPFGDSSAILNYLISYEARKYVTVALSGIGADEMFGGYPRYIGAGLSLYYQKLPYFLRQKLSCMSTKNSRGRLRRFLRGGILPMEQRYLDWLSVFTGPMKLELYTDSVKAALNDKSAGIHKSYFNQAGTTDYLDRIFYLDINTYLSDDLLFMADRMSMANSLEIRSPFCDHKLAEFCATVPYGLKIKGFKLKSLLKESFKGILPEQILKKRKQGFMLPIGDWLKDQLKSYTQEVLSENAIKKRGYFNPIFINKILKEHFEADKVHTHNIWALLMLELWFSEYIDKNEG